MSLRVPIKNREKERGPDESGLRSRSLSRTFSVRGLLAMTGFAARFLDEGG